MSFSTLLNSDYQEPELVEADLIAYKLIVEENLSVLFFKAFTKNEGLRLNTIHLTCMKKTV